ncbi:MAG TPA: biotin--[acetyl-CoA-carboxylase] ligase [Chthoniobacterales bacterium]|nr:biotin--[acetyl-CoA-carboxylase] ligase [Chthoniobacterales bacterium]
MLAADWLSAAELRAGLGHCTIGREIIVLDEATSTSDVVAQMANAGAGEGLVVFAEHQTAGRGQRGNVWESAAGKGLLCSILLRPNVAVQDSARLVNWAVKGIACTLESACLCKATIKPPNDVYIDGRKVAGVLVEMRAQPGAQHLAVVGIGVNVNQMPGHFPEELRKRATSLAIVLGGPVDRNILAVTLLRNLDQLYREGFS